MTTDSPQKAYKNKGKHKGNSNGNSNGKHKGKSNKNSNGNPDKVKKKPQNNGFSGRFINHEKGMNSKKNPMNSTSIIELMQTFFKRDSLDEWQSKLYNDIKSKANDLDHLNLDRRSAYNDMMSYRRYHSKNKIKMDNDVIILKIARVFISK